MPRLAALILSLCVAASASNTAPNRLACRSAAISESFASVVAPIPRFGVVTARMNAGSSSSFAIRRRYAIRSLISARSK